MKLKTYLIIAFSLSVVSIIGFSLISLLISDQKIIHFDRTIIDAVQGMETPFLTSVMKFFTFIGSAPFVIVLSLFLLLFLYAMNAFTVYGIITFLLWRHITSSLGRWALIFVSMVMILAIGISRIYLGVHYPSDIIGGYFASAFWITTAIIFFQYYQVKRYNKRQRREKNIA
ncbi:phosphatase PAP2 family protein [Neobacillus sp. KR4-4]|uniref:phosphatase PAP2 family protein n=1 Tax=Neobacillus sp. KR4-4 TaxID=3344872 RepID=UPI0035CA1424